MFNAIIYQLYLLQLESYELSRYFVLLGKKGIFPPSKLRGKIKWTGKARLLLAVSAFFHLIITAATTMLAYSFFPDFYVALFTFLLLIIALCFFYFLFYAASLQLIYPLQLYLKNKIILAAKEKMGKLDKLKVIGIAGSYGKTSMKETLKTVLAQKLIVEATPESVNTPIGVARFIQEKVDDKTDVLIIEMGEHYKGDILELCQITKVDIAVITGINESHLERLKDLSNSVKTVFELAQGLKSGGKLVLNSDDKNIIDNYQSFAKSKEISFYSSNNNELCDYLISEHSFSAKDLENNFVVSKDASGVHFKTKILADYGLGLAVASMIIAKEFGISPEAVSTSFIKVRPVPHRLEPLANPNGLIVIDDSYNGNPDGVREAIKLLSKFDGCRKVYLTPGLVEMGKSSQSVHQEIGKQLSKVADLVMLVRNSATPYIEQGLKENGFDEEKILWYGSAQEAHSSLDKVLKPGDVIMFQNDWGDQYI